MYLIAYFSAEGNTKRVAMELNKVLNADVYEIEPKVKYTKEDLNWMDKNSRSSVEMKNKSSRPEIVKKDLDMSKYDKIYLGFPIWWYTAPTIINTFLESYDFDNKTVILFATSGGSKWGKTVEDLKVSASKTVFVKGKVNPKDFTWVN